jgi:hypothetical protein
MFRLENVAHVRKEGDLMFCVGAEHIYTPILYSKDIIKDEEEES